MACHWCGVCRRWVVALLLSLAIDLVVSKVDNVTKKNNVAAVS